MFTSVRPGQLARTWMSPDEKFDLLIQIVVSHSWKFRGFFRGECSPKKSGLVRKYGGCSSIFLTENSFADFHIFVIGRFVASNATAPTEVHVRQLRAVLEHLDVACGVAVTSTNGERGMRPRGREVEKRVGSAQCAIKRIRVLFSGAKDTKNGITQEKWTENSSGKADWTAI